MHVEDTEMKVFSSIIHATSTHALLFWIAQAQVAGLAAVCCGAASVKLSDLPEVCYNADDDLCVAV